MAMALRLREIGDVENFEAVAVGDERVAELHGDGARTVESRGTDCRSDAWRERIIQINDDERLVGEDVGIRAGDGDGACAGEDTVGVESEGALKEIIGGIAVEKGADAGAAGFQIGIADDD